MEKIKLETRVKKFEKRDSFRFSPKYGPVCARLDGKNFSKVAQHLAKPYDYRLSNLMVETAEYLLIKTNARFAYTQSDEISLFWDDDFYFDGKVQKMASVSASLATFYFWNECEKLELLIPPLFDCRVWQVPSKRDACDVLLWRQQDCIRNSINSSASIHYSHKELDKKNTRQQKEMLLEKGINWYDYPSFFKYGTAIQRCKETKKFTTDEIKNLPEKHNARNNPDLEYERKIVKRIILEREIRMFNMKGVIFNGEKPCYWLDTKVRER